MKMLIFLISIFSVSGISIFVYHNLVVVKFYNKIIKEQKQYIESVVSVEREPAKGKWVRNGETTWDTMIFVRD